MRTIAIINQKGGVGKTTTAINVSAGLAMYKRRVLLIDLDPQGNSSISFDFDIDQLSHSMFDAMTNAGNNNWKSIIKKTHVASLAIAPASMNLAALEHELATREDRNGILNRALENINSSYDYIIIDCPPSLGLLTVNALYAAEELFIPIQLSYFALEGVRQLLTIIEMAKKELPTKGPHITGIIATLYDGRTNMSKEILKAIKG
ncbi:MAG: ParA family protein, partial [candidate division WOR-3 bacterium]